MRVYETETAVEYNTVADNISTYVSKIRSIYIYYDLAKFLKRLMFKYRIVFFLFTILLHLKFRRLTITTHFTCTCRFLLHSLKSISYKINIIYIKILS